MAQKVLITGASGLIGTRLTDLLMQKGYQVMHLGRQARSQPVPCYQWDIKNQTIDLKALEDVHTIIHLAGAGIADKRWTSDRKKEILESRTQSTKLLFDTLNTARHHVKNFISASAIGYYGFDDNQKTYSEDDPPGTDFLASVTKAWEDQADQIAKLAIRVVKIRVGIVMSEKGGALKEMALPVRWGIGAPIASGNQMVSWIHLDDLCEIFLRALENESMRGAFNAVTPMPVSNRELTKCIAQVLKKPLWLPPVPAFALKLVLGEMADLVVNGNRVSSKKIEEAGFRFRYVSLHDALTSLLTSTN